MKTRKKIIHDYKQKKFRIGVFQIRNLSNGKVFIESSTDLDSIWNRHRFQLNGGLHANAALQRDWRALGEEQFAFEILSEIEQDDTPGRDYRRESRQLEQMFKEEMQPFGDKGYH